MIEQNIGPILIGFAGVGFIYVYGIVIHWAFREWISERETTLSRSDNGKKTTG